MKDGERRPHHHGHTHCMEGASDRPLKRKRKKGQPVIFKSKYMQEVK